jgi:hypothetical protein
VLEDPRELIVGDPGAVVGHADNHFVIVPAHLDLDAAAGIGEFDGVAEQVAHDRIQPVGIAHDEQGLIRRLIFHGVVLRFRHSAGPRWPAARDR